MKRLLVGVALTALVGMLALLQKQASVPPESRAPTTEAKAPMPLDTVVAGGSAAAPELGTQPGSPLVEDLLRREGTPEQDLETVRQLISQYFTALQSQSGPPIGDNADLVRALTGNNPLKLVVIPPGHPVLGGDGLLRDRWGTPYHLHRLSTHTFEIRSAGPDRRLFTADDVSAP